MLRLLVNRDQLIASEPFLQKKSYFLVLRVPWGNTCWLIIPTSVSRTESDTATPPIGRPARTYPKICWVIACTFIGRSLAKLIGGELSIATSGAHWTATDCLLRLRTRTHQNPRVTLRKEIQISQNPADSATTIRVATRMDGGSTGGSGRRV
jgi:hypothetical protein